MQLVRFSLDAPHRDGDAIVFKGELVREKKRKGAKDDGLNEIGEIQGNKARVIYVTSGIWFDCCLSIY